MKNATQKGLVVAACVGAGVGLAYLSRLVGSG